MEDAHSFPVMTTLKSEEEELKPTFYLDHLYHGQRKDNVKVEASDNNLDGLIKSETKVEDCEKTQGTSNTEASNYLQAKDGGKTLSFSDLEYFRPEIEDDCDNYRAHGSSINSEMENITAKTFPSCSKCGENCKDQQSLQKHLTKGSLSCFNSKVNFDVNLQNGDPKRNDEIKCDVCAKIFGNKVNLRIHMRIHTGDKPFSCDVCGQRFCQKSNLNQHRRIHTGVKPFNCIECGQTFCQKSNLNQHMRVHTGVKPFSCDECGKTFSQKSSLDKHINIHTKDKPFSCDICGLTFCQRSTLSQHIKIHTGDKPFSCDECGQTFCQKSTLTRHMRIHSGARPFPCEVCGELFRWQNCLKGHMHVHTTEKK